MNYSQQSHLNSQFQIFSTYLSQLLPNQILIFFDIVMSSQSFSGRVIAKLSSERRGKLSAKKELILSNGSGQISRLTLWEPHHSMEYEINQMVTIEIARTQDYYGRVFSSTKFSKVVGLEVVDGDPKVDEILSTGGLKFETLDQIKARICEKPAFGYLKGVLLSFDNDFWYNGCVQCRRKVVETCTVCALPSKSFLLLKCVIQTDQAFIKVTFFQDAVDGLLSCRTESQLEAEVGKGRIRTAFQSLIDKEIGFHVKGQKRQFTSKDEDKVEFVQWTGRPPLFRFA